MKTINIVRATDPRNRARADKYAGHPVKLNGHEARICGRLHRYGTVACLNIPLSASFSWEAIENVIENNNAEFGA